MIVSGTRLRSACLLAIIGALFISDNHPMSAIIIMIVVATITGVAWWKEEI